MTKKHFTLLLLFSAYLLQLGHGLFPHSHHINHHSEVSENHNHHHNDEDHSNENGISHFFCHFNHSADIFTYTISDVKIHLKKQSSETLQKVFNVFLSFNSGLFVTKKSLSILKIKDSFVNYSPHLICLQFRGPPVYIS